MFFLDISSIKKLPKVSCSFSQRRIIFYDDIDEESAFEFINFINKIQFLDERLKTKEPIEIMISSYGGSVYSGFTIISTIEQLIDMGYNVITTNIGTCFSMGFAIFVAGKERRCYKYGRFMYHDILTAPQGKVQEIKEDIVECEKLLNYIDSIIVKNTNLEQDQLLYWRERKLDKYFSLDEAIENGIVNSNIV